MIHYLLVAYIKFISGIKISLTEITIRIRDALMRCYFETTKYTKNTKSFFGREGGSAPRRIYPFRVFRGFIKKAGYQRRFSSLSIIAVRSLRKSIIMIAVDTAVATIPFTISPRVRSMGIAYTAASVSTHGSTDSMANLSW